MPFLHIVNTNFEAELLQARPASLIASIQSHPIFLQLQFLPLLYAGADDCIGVTHAPYPSFSTPKWQLLEERDFPYRQIEGWGASPSMSAWAEKHKIDYSMPSWEVVQKVNSKAFSYQESPKLPGSALIHNWQELEEWDGKTKEPKVLKSCFGVSGKGHLFLPSGHMKKFAEKEFSAGRPVVAEPWVERILDFSTQWMIHKDKGIEYLGPTLLISDGRGRYTANKVGDPEILFGRYLSFLDRHKEIALPILQKMAARGYFGNVGIDAMIWGSGQLQPVVEINARKTMGWVALQFSKLHFRKQTIALSYLTNSSYDNLLPSAVVQKNGSLLRFQRKLVVEN
jgi:hypothetical protein